MLLFGIFVLVIKIILTVSVSSFKALPDVEVNDVYNSSDTVMETVVTIKEECALICESMGELRCQSFNVKPHGEKVRCEMFDHKPINGKKMVEDENAKLFERQCEPVYVIASMKERLKDNQTLVTLIDDKGAVYQVKSSDPRLRFIGNFSTVFEGYMRQPDDLLQMTVIPYGDVHLIREGMWFYCYQSVDETHQRFFPCQPKEMFPLHFAQVTSLSVADAPLFVANDETNVFFAVYSPNVETRRLGTPKGLRFDNVDPLESKTLYNCTVAAFCPYWPMFKQTSSALVISFTEIGLFWNAQFYIYDFIAHRIVLRYSVCRREDASYLLNGTQISYP